MYFYCLYELIINHQVLAQLLCANILLSLSEINTYLYSELLYPMVTGDRSNETSWAPAVGGGGGGGGGARVGARPSSWKSKLFSLLGPFLTLFYIFVGGLFIGVGGPFLSSWGAFLDCPPPYENFCGRQCGTAIKYISTQQTGHWGFLVTVTRGNVDNI